MQIDADTRGLYCVAVSEPPFPRVSPRNDQARTGDDITFHGAPLITRLSGRGYVMQFDVRSVYSRGCEKMSNVHANMGESAKM